MADKNFEGFDDGTSDSNKLGCKEGALLGVPDVTIDGTALGPMLGLLLGAWE